MTISPIPSVRFPHHSQPVRFEGWQDKVKAGAKKTGQILNPLDPEPLKDSPKATMVLGVSGTSLLMGTMTIPILLVSGVGIPVVLAATAATVAGGAWSVTKAVKADNAKKLEVETTLQSGKNAIEAIGNLRPESEQLQALRPYLEGQHEALQRLAVSKIGEYFTQDSTKLALLEPFCKNPDADPRLVREVIRGVASIESDADKARLLLMLCQPSVTDQGVIQSLQQVISSLKDDDLKGQVGLQYWTRVLKKR